MKQNYQHCQWSDYCKPIYPIVLQGNNRPLIPDAMANSKWNRRTRIAKANGPNHESTSFGKLAAPSIPTDDPLGMSTTHRGRDFFQETERDMATTLAARKWKILEPRIKTNENGNPLPPHAIENPKRNWGIRIAKANGPDRGSTSPHTNFMLHQIKRSVHSKKKTCKGYVLARRTSLHSRCARNASRGRKWTFCNRG